MYVKCHDCGAVIPDCNLFREYYPRYCAFDEVITKCPFCGCDRLDEAEPDEIEE